MPDKSGVIGVSDHGGWAIFVTAARDGTLLDRRRVELVDDTLPSIPHHHEAQMLPMDAALALVERVRLSAERHAIRALDAEAAATPRILGIALRVCPQLPPTVAERIKDYRARNVADWVMYRQALAAAAEKRGWPVHWYDSKKVAAAASRALGFDFDAHFLQMRKAVGPPWNQDYKLAMAAAIEAAQSWTS
ncbi:MAG: hypothetical protein JO192_03435 [Candidatus Eremiobacteraeota bacterium]|nr:hypothetical protein [Candidatus Eremiobacteraeota bacterium]